MRFKDWLEDYQMNHRPPDGDFGAPLHDLTKIYPHDIYDTVHQYAVDDMERESGHLAKRYRGRPEREAWIFRAVPKGVRTINSGDWVTINRGYAIQHSKHPSDPGQDMDVIAARVPASQIHTDGNSLAEWGYNGTETLKCILSYKPRRRSGAKDI